MSLSIRILLNAVLVGSTFSGTLERVLLLWLKFPFAPVEKEMLTLLSFDEDVFLFQFLINLSPLYESIIQQFLFLFSKKKLNRHFGETP